jgi:hypothetical protein
VAVVSTSLDDSSTRVWSVKVFRPTLKFISNLHQKELFFIRYPRQVVSLDNWVKKTTRIHSISELEILNLFYTDISLTCTQAQEVHTERAAGKSQAELKH